jgi:iron complex outermembrane recepter protein
MRTISKFLCSSALVCVLSTSMPALAAEAPAAQADNGPGEIVVTAQKRPELLSKTPVAISAATGGELRSQGVTSAIALGNIVPSAHLENANGGVQVTIRGVSNSDASTAGDPSAAFQVNGVYIARRQAFSTAFFDLDRVEILRGPQGTLYGRNATAGVVNIISAKPKEKLEAALNAEYGNYNTKRVDGMVNIPVTDNLAIRAAGAFNQHDSYLLNAPGQNRKLGNDQDDASGRLSALWNFGGDHKGSLYVVADYSHQGGQGPQVQPVSVFYNNPFGSNPTYIDGNSQQRRTVPYTFASTQRLNNKAYGVSAELNYDLGLVGFTYVGSYRRLDIDSTNVQGFPKTPSYPDQNIKSQNYQTSHELRLATTGDGPLKAVVGAYYFVENTQNNVTTLPNFGGYSVYAFLTPSVFSKSYAFFGQSTYNVTDGLRVTGGVRYSHDDKSTNGLIVGQTGSTVLDPSLYKVLSVNNAHAASSKVTWKVGVDYDVTKRILAYASVSTGYKAGGFNSGCDAGTAGCTSPTAASRLYYRPETLTAYEAGLKGRYLDGTLTLNLTGFYYDYGNLQLSSLQEPPAPPVQVVLNAGKARIKGAEIEAIATPTKRDRFDLSVSLLDAHYVQYMPNLTTSFAGMKLDNSPATVVFYGYTHTFPLASGATIKARAESRYSSTFYESDYNIPYQYRQPGYTKSNVIVTYSAPGDRWYLQGYANNLENKVVFTSYSSGRAYVTEPRTYGVRAGFKF